MIEQMTARDRVEHIRATRVDDEDIQHLLRMYDESLRVNVGLIAHNSRLQMNLDEIRAGGSVNGLLDDALSLLDLTRQKIEKAKGVRS